MDRDSYLRSRYGITEEQYAKMFRMQKGVCWICKKPPKKKRLAVDHDHKTGRVRGLLCFRCNKLIVGKHTVATAKILLAYLNRDFDGRNL